MKITKTGNGLQKAIDALADPRPFLEEAGDILVANTVARIVLTKQDPKGQAWPAWATSTLIARTKKGNAGNGLLFDDGTLARSIKSQVNGKSVEVGSDGSAPYAVFLQEGTANMPARPFIGISKQDRDEVHAALVDYFRKNTK